MAIRDDNGRFIKPDGRPKGSKNKITRDLRKLNEQIIIAIQEQVGIENIIKECKPDTVLQYIARIMPKDFEMKVDVKRAVELLLNMTEKDIKMLINNE